MSDAHQHQQQGNGNEQNQAGSKHAVTSRLHEQKACPFATITAFLVCYCHVLQQWSPTMYACNDAAPCSGLELLV